MYIYVLERRRKVSQKNSSKTEKSSFLSKLYNVSTSFTKSYDRSLTAKLALLVRRGALKTSAKIVGVFLLTFGVYSALSAWIISLLFDYAPDRSAIYGGIILMICSLPLIISSANISEALLQSFTGSTVCEYLHIRKDSLFEKEKTGHLSVGFVAGVLAGAATAAIPFETVLLSIAIAVAAGIILCVPEAGITISAVLLFVADIDIQYIIISITALSFVFKLVRKKRRIRERKTDLLITVFILCSAGAVMFCAGGNLKESALSYVFLIIPFFLIVYLIRDCRKAIKILHTLVFFAGCISALYIASFSLSVLSQYVRITDADALLNAVKALPAFETGFMSLANASLIPIAVAFTVKPKSGMSRMTFILPLVSMTVYLLVSGNIPYVICAFLLSAVLLIISGSRWIYFAICAALFSAVMVSFAGSFGERLYRYVYRNLYELYNSTESIRNASSVPVSDEYLLWGRGFSVIATEGSNFYHSILSALGVVGFILFSVFVLFIIGHAVRIIIKAYTLPCLSKGMTSYQEIGNRDEIKMGMLASVCSLGVILLCSAFCNLYQNELSYLFLFSVGGICSAYARSSDREISKIKGSLILKCSNEKADVVIGHEQD